MIAPRWVTTPTQPIAVADVVRYLVGVARLPEALGQSFDAGGPDVLTYREMIERIARLRGRRPLIVESPCRARGSRPTGFISSRRSGRLRTPADRGPSQSDGRTRRRLRALLPFRRTSFDDAARAALSRPAA